MPMRVAHALATVDCEQAWVQAVGTLALEIVPFARLWLLFRKEGDAGKWAPIRHMAGVTQVERHSRETAVELSNDTLARIAVALAELVPGLLPQALAGGWLVPFAQAGTVAGALYLEPAAGQTVFSPATRELLGLLAAQAGTTLALLRAKAALAASRAECELLAASRDMNVDLEHRVADRTRELTEVNRTLQQEVGERRELEARLATERNLLRTLIDNMPDQIFVKSTESRFIIANRATAEVIGLPLEELVGKGDMDVYPAASAQEFFDDEQTMLRSGQSLIDKVERNVNREGLTRWFSTTKVPLRDAKGNATALIGICRDITMRMQAEESLRLRNRAIESSINAVFITDFRLPGNPIAYVNPAFERITGFGPADILGHGLGLLCTNAGAWEALQPMLEACREGRESHAVLQASRKDGSLLWYEIHLAPVRDDEGEVTHFVGIMNDITQAREYEAQLSQLARFDMLTGLPNRRLLLERLNHALPHAEREKRTIAVVFFDLDRFKSINDTLGHEAGDVLLKTVAERVGSSIRKGDTAARMGGDEFVLILPEHRAETGQDGMAADSHLGVLDVLKRVQARIAEPITLGGQEMVVTSSMGVSFFPHDAQDAETLLRHADSAMYQAKEQGRNRFHLYTEEMNQRMSEQLTLENLLRSAVMRNELSLAYQPKIDTRDGRLCGVEALLRWKKGGTEPVPPAVFVPILERTGMINEVGMWVLRQALADRAAWQKAGLPCPRIAVNVSQVQLAQKNFIDAVSALLAEHPGQAGSLELEMTESLVMQHAGDCIAKLQALREMGISIAIDDFGTGYSSLSHLATMPANAIKIDRSFIATMLSSPRDYSIVASIISLAHTLKLTVIAEGVETEEQLTALAALGCEEVQGYLFSKPLELHALLQWQRQYKPTKRCL